MQQFGVVWFSLKRPDRSHPLTSPSVCAHLHRARLQECPSDWGGTDYLNGLLSPQSGGSSQHTLPMGGGLTIEWAGCVQHRADPTHSLATRHHRLASSHPAQSMAKDSLSFPLVTSWCLHVLACMEEVAKLFDFLSSSSSSDLCRGAKQQMLILCGISAEELAGSPYASASNLWISSDDGTTFTNVHSINELIADAMFSSVADANSGEYMVRTYERDRVPCLCVCVCVREREKERERERESTARE